VQTGFLLFDSLFVAFDLILLRLDPWILLQTVNAVFVLSFFVFGF
jgi:hypothetical protein